MDAGPVVLTMLYPNNFCYTVVVASATASRFACIVKPGMPPKKAAHRVHPGKARHPPGPGAWSEKTQ